MRMTIRRPKGIKVLAGVILPFVALYFIVTSFGTRKVQRLLKDNTVCNASLGPTREQDLEKVLSYKFDNAQYYLKELFLLSSSSDTMPTMPVLVTAFSSSHFIEGMAMVRNINNVVRKRHKNMKFFIYNLGLTDTHQKEVMAVCDCELRQFPFDNFPDHVRIMKGYAWKPLAIQLIAREHPFVIWMDASVRFTTDDLNFLFEDAKKLGVMASEGYAAVAMRTMENTFKLLNEEPCIFRDKNEFEATFIVIYADDFVMNNFMRPWVSCALEEGCMVPEDDPSKYIHCNYKGDPVYFHCHRFDQSMLSILLHRLYHSDIDKHRMKHAFYQFCKGGDELWFAPHFVNEIVISYQERCF